MFKEEHKLEYVQKRASKMIKCMSIMLYVEYLKGLGIFKLKNNRVGVVVQSLLSNPLHILWKKDVFYSKYFESRTGTED